MKSCISLLFLLLPVTPLWAQFKLPVIKATSKSVSINDGGVLSKNSWNLSPQARPDIFTADRTRQTKWVTFYTDVDSIRIKVKPGSTYNFIILFNGKDSCYTRVNSAIPSEDRLNGFSRPDTIPFRLTAFNAIAIRALVNGKDTLSLHFDASSSGIHFLKDVRIKKFGQQKISSLQIGHMELKDPTILTTNVTSQEMDGRIGFNVFEGKQVELNYDKHLMVITSRLPNIKGYARSKLIFSNGFPCITGDIKAGGQTYHGIFTLDNGSATAMVLDSAWAARANTTAQFKLIRSSTIRDANGKKYETRVVQAPVFSFGKFDLTNVPATIFATRSPFGPELNFLGNDLMKRFNMILDFKNDVIYIKENQLFNAPYRDSNGS